MQVWGNEIGVRDPKDPKSDRFAIEVYEEGR